MINPAERESAKAKFNKQELPTKEDGWYVVYQYTFGGPYIVSSPAEDKARELADEFKKKPDCTFSDVTNGYPYEVAIKWKEEDKKNKKK